MTKQSLKSYIQKDIKKLGREREGATPKNPSSCENETLRIYLAARHNTLKEILALLC